MRNFLRAAQLAAPAPARLKSAHRTIATNGLRRDNSGFDSSPGGPSGEH
jgi:hypothetical protein